MSKYVMMKTAREVWTRIGSTLQPTGFIKIGLSFMHVDERPWHSALAQYLWWTLRTGWKSFCFQVGKPWTEGSQTCGLRPQVLRSGKPEPPSKSHSQPFNTRFPTVGFPRIGGLGGAGPIYPLQEPGVQIPKPAIQTTKMHQEGHFHKCMSNMESEPHTLRGVLSTLSN